MGRSENQKEGCGERQRIETYGDAQSQKERKMVPNLSIRKEKKKKSILPREIPFAGTP